MRAPVDRARHRSPPSVPRTTFKDIDFGEDDANIEWEIAHLNARKPVFLQAFFDHPQLGLKALQSGHKYFVLGQKGTGKTAVLRKIQFDAEEQGGATSFMIFRDEVASREELDKLGSVFAVNINDVRQIHHHLYTLERLLLMVVLSKLKDAPDPDAEEEQDPVESGSVRSMIRRVWRQPLQRVVEVALNSVSEVAQVASIDPSKLSKGVVHVDATTLLRKTNERLTALCVTALRRQSQNLSVFIDEIHFTYRSGQDHDQDASLVRDLIRAVNRVNKSFASASVKCKIYAALRSEFLSHPLISAAELHPSLSSYGTEISWSTFPANFDHPMFEIGAKRVDVSTSSRFNGRAFMQACFASFSNEEATEFVRSTWSKPRDMVRFLRTCRDMFPDKITLSKTEYSSVFHSSCIKAWKEVETALTSFLTIKGVEQVKSLIGANSSVSLERGHIGAVETFLKKLAPIAKQQTQIGAMTEATSLFRILYMLGVVYTTRETIKHERIIHSFHRGQENPDMDGNVAIHRGVAKAFS